MTLKSQIDMYKKQMQELHEQILSDETKMKKLEYEYKGVEETCNNLRQEKDKLQSEYERLKDTHDQMTSSVHAADEDFKQSSDENSSAMDGLFSGVELVNISNEAK